MPLSCQHKKYGFTLVELAIVLVIIGLIIGGVLVGQDLISAAKVRAQIKQIEETETQINTFKVKYGCIPGDCGNATEFFGTTASTGSTIRNGNNDNIIKSDYGANGTLYGSGECLEVDALGEVSQFYLHLYSAGLGKDITNGNLLTPMARIRREYPEAAYGNGTGIFVSCLYSVTQATLTAPFLRKGNIIVIGASGFTGTDSGGGGNRLGYVTGHYGARNTRYGKQNDGVTSYGPMGIPAIAARMIDEKIDDAKPSSGRFGIIAGEVGCDNTYNSSTGGALLAAYPNPNTSCNTTVGKKID